MKRMDSILQQANTKIKLLILFILILPLCACEDTCPTIQDYLFKGIGSGPDDCLLCPIFNVLIDASKKVAVIAWKKLAAALVPVVGIVAAIYIAIYTLKMVGSFGKQTANDYMTSDKNGVLFFMFKTAVIVFLLSGGMSVGGLLSSIGLGAQNEDNFLIQKIISPILKSGLEIGQALAVKSGNATSFDFYASQDMASLVRSAGELLFGTTPWAQIFEMIRQAVYGFNQVVYEPVAIGQAMICNATTGSLFSWYYLMLLYGFILFIFGWLLVFGIGFYIVDVLIDLMFAAVLLPIGVACAISPKTVDYTKKIWGMFITIFFDFVMLGIVLGITMQIVDLSLNRAVEGVSDATSVVMATGGAIANFMTNYQDHVDANEIEQLSKELWSNGNLLLTIVCLSVTTMLISQIKGLAGKISGGTSVSSVGEKVSAAAGQHAMHTAKRAGRESYNRVIKPAAQSAGNKFVKATRLDKGYNNIKRGAAIARGFLTGRGSQGHRAWWR